MTPQDFNPIELLHNKLVLAQPNRFYWDEHDRKVHLHRRDITRGGPWIWPHRSGMRNCMLYHRVLFSYLRILPYPCLGCWKVVVTLPNLKAMYEMYKFMLEWKEYPDCKLGIETRYYADRNYGAYYYFRTKREGLDFLKIIRETEIATSGNLSIKLKRGCTEFEIAFGPSDEWDSIVTPQEIAIQQHLMDLIHCPKMKQNQEVYQRQMTSKLWQTFAAEVEMESVTYEEYEYHSADTDGDVT